VNRTINTSLFSYQSEQRQMAHSSLTATISKHPYANRYNHRQEVIIANTLQACVIALQISLRHTLSDSHCPIDSRDFEPAKTFHRRAFGTGCRPLAHGEQTRRLHGSAAASRKHTDSDVGVTTARIEEPSSALEGGCPCATATAGTNCACDSDSQGATDHSCIEERTPCSGIVVVAP
jgi:hypothetical protein